MAGTETPRRERPPGSVRSSWEPQDLTKAATGERPAAPSILKTADGRYLLYRGRVHLFAGESESLKSWLAQLACLQVLREGGRVLWIDYEDSPDGLLERLRLLGAADENLRSVIYLRPSEPLRPRGSRGRAASLLEAELRQGFDLAVVDGVTEAMSLEGLDLNSNGDVAVWLRLLPKWIAELSGAATVFIDHVSKTQDARGRFAIGGQHKLAGIDGAAYTFRVLSRGGRALGETSNKAVVALTISKDRPGFIRALAAKDRVGDFELVAHQDGTAEASVTKPVGVPQSSDVSAELAQRVVLLVCDEPGLAKSTVEKRIGGKSVHVRSAIESLIRSGSITLRPDGKAHLLFPPANADTAR
jgi:hypothetical protein